MNNWKLKMTEQETTPLNSMEYSGWLKKKGSKQGLWHKRFAYISKNNLYVFLFFITNFLEFYQRATKSRLQIKQFQLPKQPKFN